MASAEELQGVYRDSFVLEQKLVKELEEARSGPADINRNHRIRRINDDLKRVVGTRVDLEEGNPWLRAKPEAPEPEGGPATGIKSIFKTLGSPPALGTGVVAGAAEAATLPERLLERAGITFKTPEGKPTLKKEGLEHYRAKAAKSAEEAGIEPEALGPSLAKGLGYAPYGGPTTSPLRSVFSREALKEAGKGAATVGALGTASQLAETGEFPEAGELGGYAAGGGLLQMLLGRFMGRKLPPAAKPEAAAPKAPPPPSGAAPPPGAPKPPPPPKPAPAAPPEAPQMELPLGKVKKERPLTPAEALDEAVKLDKETKKAIEELEVGDIISGKKALSDVKPPEKPPKKPEKPKPPKSEPPAEVAGEAGGKVEAIPAAATPEERARIEKIVGRPLGEKPAEVAPQIVPEAHLEQPGKIAKPSEIEPLVEPPSRPMVLEKYMQRRGYRVEEKSDPVQGTWYRVYDKDRLVAQGDRDTIQSAMQAREGEKGITLYGGFGGVEEAAKLLSDSLRKAGSRAPEIAETALDVARTVGRPFQVGRRAASVHPAMAEAQDVMQKAHAGVGKRFRDFLYKGIDEGVPEPTKYFQYNTLGQDARKAVDRLLWYGDKVEKDFTKPEYLRMLVARGLSPDEVSAYQGVREALTKARSEVRSELKARREAKGPKLTVEELAVEELGDLPGYMPHTWGGRWEVWRDGHKVLRPGKEGSIYEVSGFRTQREAVEFSFGIKKGEPGAKVEIKHFADPEYLSVGPLEESILVGRIKRNLAMKAEVEGKASISSEMVDEALRFGRDVKGFARHLLHRKGSEGFETANTDRIIQGYLYNSARFVEMSQMKRAVSEVLRHSKDLSEVQMKWVQNRVERTAGKPAWDEAVIHNMIKGTKLGYWLDPLHGSNAVQTVRHLATHLTLGLGNVSYALINAGVVFQHVWPGLSREAFKQGLGSAAAEKFLARALKEFHTDKALRQKLAHEGVIDIQMMSEKVPHISGRMMTRPLGDKTGLSAADVSMFLGTMTEEWSRGVAAIARYRMALAQGWPENEAIEAARRFVADTVGEYSIVGKPAAFTGAIGGVVGMFKTFVSVMMANGWSALRGASQGDVGTLTRYIMANVGLAGLLGMPGADNVDEFITRHFGYSPIQSLEDNLPRGILTGLTSVVPDWMGYPEFSVDISKRVGIPDLVPTDLRSASGPIIGRFASAIARIMEGRPGDAIEQLVIPNSLRGVVEAVSPGKLKYRDRPTVHYKPEEALVRGLGFMPEREAQDVRQYRRRSLKDAYRDERLRVLADRILDNPRDASAYNEFAELGGSSVILQNAQRAREQTMLERQERQLPRILRR